MCADDLSLNGSLSMRSVCLVAFALAAIFAIPEASAEPNKEQYELQERCGKRAEQVFKSDNPGQPGGAAITNTDEGQNITSYQNHYSSTLNKCFYLLITNSMNYKKQPQYMTTLITLLDLNENKEYGTFFRRSDSREPTHCNVQQKICHSQSEWEELLKPYMEE
jgi:hypothetical protein